MGEVAPFRSSGPSARRRERTSERLALERSLSKKVSSALATCRPYTPRRRPVQRDPDFGRSLPVSVSSVENRKRAPPLSPLIAPNHVLVFRDGTGTRRPGHRFTAHSSARDHRASIRYRRQDLKERHTESPLERTHRRSELDRARFSSGRPSRLRTRPKAINDSSAGTPADHTIFVPRPAITAPPDLPRPTGLVLRPSQTVDRPTIDGAGAGEKQAAVAAVGTGPRFFVTSKQHGPLASPRPIPCRDAIKLLVSDSSCALPQSRA